MWLSLFYFSLVMPEGSEDSWLATLRMLMRYPHPTPEMMRPRYTYPLDPPFRFRDEPDYAPYSLRYSTYNPTGFKTTDDS